MKRNCPTVITPTCEIVDEYLEKWQYLDKYVWQEKALDHLFCELSPCNTELKDILLKCAALNDFYSTNIFSVFPVAQHIQKLNIDARIKKYDLNLVEDIQKVEINGVEKQFYSFASKYCSHNNPIDYPIYDSFVDKVLCHFRNMKLIKHFKNDDLKDYNKFRTILLDFREQYSLKKYNLKEIDRYLWQLGKEIFPRKY